jgi:hypothetical protein
MGLLDDHLAAISSHAAGLGMADACTYTPHAGGAAVSLTVPVAEVGSAFQEALDGEISRREADLVLRRAQIAAPAREDQLVFSTGAYAGTWFVIRVDAADEAGWRLRIRRRDQRTELRGPGVRRMP